MSSENAMVTTTQTIRVPPLKPQKIVFWFSLFERQLAAEGIKDDEEKATALLGCLESEYLERIEDIALYPPATGQYDRLKDELVRSLADSDSERVKRLVENEVMGDRKRSQFYYELKKLESPFASEQFVLTLWKNRLPDRIRHVLAVIDDRNVEKLIQAADRLEEACTGSIQRESGISAVNSREVQNVGAADTTATVISAFLDKMKQRRASIDALSNDGRRRARSRLPGRHRHRSRVTVLAVRKRGERRLHASPPHYYWGPATECRLFNRYWRGHMRLSAHKGTWTCEQKRLRTVPGEYNPYCDI